MLHVNDILYFCNYTCLDCFFPHGLNQATTWFEIATNVSGLAFSFAWKIVDLSVECFSHCETEEEWLFGQYVVQLFEVTL